jgi:hypothetical protein
MLRAIQFFSCLSLGLVVSMQTGCSKPDTATEPTAAETDDHADHDDGDHEHAADFGGAIAELEELAGTISASMAKDDPDAAHNSLHEIGHVLEGLPELAKQEGLSDDQQKSVTGAVATLMDSYGDLDAGMHGEEGKSWDDLKGSIDTAVETLTAFEHGHEHGDHDHEHGDDDHDHGDHDHGDHDGDDHDHKDGDHDHDGDDHDHEDGDHDHE